MGRSRTETGKDKVVVSKTKQAKGKAMKPKQAKGKGTKRAKTSMVEPEEDIFMGLKNLNENQKNRWRNLVKPGRQLQVTRFLDVGVLTTLGLDGPVGELMRNTGLEGFLGKSAPVYRRFTLEFLSTVERTKDRDQSEVQFHLNDSELSLSYYEVGELLGAEESRDVFDHKDKMAATVFFLITGLPFTRQHKFASTLSNPAWKLFYRGLSMTFLGKGEPAQLSTEDMALMRSGLERAPSRPCWVDTFLAKCEGYSTQTSGNIPVGGMITLLARYYPCTPSYYDVAERVGGPHYYDLPWLCQHDKFATVPGNEKAYRFLYGAGLWVRCNAEVTIPSGSEARDWRMPGVFDVDGPLEPEGGEVEMRDQGNIEARAPEHQGGYEVIIRMLQDRQAIEDKRWEEVVDRLEVVEDLATTNDARLRQMEHWMQQQEPRTYVPLSDEFHTMMYRRREAKIQRRASRQPRSSGETSGSQQPQE